MRPLTPDEIAWEREINPYPRTWGGAPRPAWTGPAPSPYPQPTEPPRRRWRK